jgi:hypothetical protein
MDTVYYFSPHHRNLFHVETKHVNLSLVASLQNIML